MYAGLLAEGRLHLDRLANSAKPTELAPLRFDDVPNDRVIKSASPLVLRARAFPGTIARH